MRFTDWNKIAPEYFKHIQSPFSKGVRNLVYHMLKKAGGPKNKAVLEIGCGVGTLVPFLAKHVKNHPS